MDLVHGDLIWKASAQDALNNQRFFRKDTKVDAFEFVGSERSQSMNLFHLTRVTLLTSAQGLIFVSMIKNLNDGCTLDTFGHHHPVHTDPIAQVLF